MAELVLIESRAGWRKLTLNRPDRLNALNADVHAALQAAFAEAAADAGCRAVLLTGAGRAFCAGQDLAEVVGGGEKTDLGEWIEQRYNRLVRLIRSAPQPVVCAVNGIAAGAGANIALACDIVVAARSATFGQAFVKIGLIPDSGGTFFLPRLVGEARARALAMLGDPISAEQAEAWGMIWKCADDDALPAEAEALTARLAAMPTVAIALMKRAFAAAWENGLDAQLDVERELQSEAGRSTDHAEGVQAFLEKRAPRFTGRG